MALAILSANVFTGDPARPRAEAVGIENGKIVAVGGNDEVRLTLRGKVEEFDEVAGPARDPGVGRRPLPFSELWALSATGGLAGPSLPAGMPGEDPGDGAAQQARRVDPGGRGWNHHNWVEQREPRRQDLDDIAPENPVMMVRACGHSQWVNSQALTAAKITRETPDPAGGQIDRDPGSGSTGMLRELRYLIEKGHARSQPQARKQAALLAQKDALPDRASPGCIPVKDSSNGKPSTRWTEPGPLRCGCITCCRRMTWTRRRPAGFARRMAASASGPGT